MITKYDNEAVSVGLLTSPEKESLIHLIGDLGYDISHMVADHVVHDPSYIWWVLDSDRRVSGFSAMQIGRKREVSVSELYALANTANQSIPTDLVIGDFESRKQLEQVWQILKDSGATMGRSDFTYTTYKALVFCYGRIGWSSSCVPSNITTTDFIAQYGSVEPATRRPNPPVKESIAKEEKAIHECDCPMTIGGITHTDPSCSKYAPKYKPQAPLAMTLENYSAEELNRMTTTDSDVEIPWA